jgi:four helix bundle protein
LGSLAETEYLLEFSLKIGYLNNEIYTKLQERRQEVGNILWKFYKSI